MKDGLVKRYNILTTFPAISDIKYFSFAIKHIGVIVKLKLSNMRIFGTLRLLRSLFFAFPRFENLDIRVRLCLSFLLDHATSKFLGPGRISFRPSLAHILTELTG